MHKIRHDLLQSTDFKIILVAVIYFLGAYLGLLLAFPDPITSPVWPPVGIGFALVIFLGSRTWPGITIGSLVAYMLVFWLNGIEINAGMIQASIIIAIGNTVEILFGAFLLKVYIKKLDPFKNTRDTFAFLLIALTMCLIGSSLGTYSLYINNLFDKQDIIS